MAAFICKACGTEFPLSASQPETCPVCEDERQFVPPGGQGWTTHQSLTRAHSNTFRQHEAGVIAIHTAPHFAIGQRAFLLLSKSGNVLWDCVSLLDPATIAVVKSLGGLSAIAISHPHFYTSMNRWSETFGAPVYVHADDRQWVVNAGPDITFWPGDRHALLPGMTIIRCGGHFAGSSVLHWADAADSRGALFSGDTLLVTADRRHVTFMRSYPNLLPVSASVVKRISGRLAADHFDRIYAAFPEREIETGGKDALDRSARRYIEAVSADGPADLEP